MTDYRVNIKSDTVLTRLELTILEMKIKAFFDEDDQTEVSAQFD